MVDIRPSRTHRSRSLRTKALLPLCLLPFAEALHLHAPAVPNRRDDIFSKAFVPGPLPQQHHAIAVHGVKYNLNLRGGSALELEGNLRGVLAIIAAIFVQVEAFGRLSRSAVLPAVATRKLTHIFTGE